MSIAEELTRLEQLRDRGTISEAEFTQAKARLLAGEAAPSPVVAANSFRRSGTDKWIGGVCGGLARSTGLASWIWRVIFVIFFCFGGTGALVYLLLWIFAPTD